MTDYHLNTRRANLLRPIRHLLKGTILEIGAGAGVATRFMGESGAQVVAVEADWQRAAIATTRCADLPNVRVVADDFACLPSGPQFDVVTLIGVEENARMFSGEAGGDPVAGLIARARTFVRPGGILVAAFENKLGLRYLAGRAQHHSDGARASHDHWLRDEPDGAFERTQFSGWLADSGMVHQQWWFPLPDHRLPVSILSDRVLLHEVDLSALLVEAVRLDPQIEGAIAFSLERGWQRVYRNRLLGDLANAFLVVSSHAALPDHHVLGVHYGAPRRPEFMKEVRFEWQDGAVQVRRTRLNPDHAGIPSRLVSLHLVDEPFLAARSWHHELRSLTARTGWTLEEFTAWARRWLDAVLLHAGLPCVPSIGPATRAPGHLIDAIPQNMAFDETGMPHFFDQEWHLNEPTDIGMIVYRGIFSSLDVLTGCAQPQIGVDLSKMSLFLDFTESLGWQVNADDIIRYAQLEGRIQEAVSGGMARPLSTLREPIPVHARVAPPPANHGLWRWLVEAATGIGGFRGLRRLGEEDDRQSPPIAFTSDGSFARQHRSGPKPWRRMRQGLRRAISRLTRLFTRAPT